jgi:hypothetical protein
MNEMEERNMVGLRRDTKAEADYVPLDAGWDARLEGEQMNENPWAVNNWKHYEWVKGWLMANESDAAEPIAD